MRATSFFTYELQVTTYCTSYKLNLSYKLWVPIYSYILFIRLLHRLFISLVGPLKNRVILVSYSWTKYFMNEWFNIELQSSLKFLYISTTYFLQHEVFLASWYWAINFVNVCSNCKLYATKLWHSKWKVGFWMQQEFYWCNNKSLSTKSIYDNWNHIRTFIVPFSIYYIRNSSLYVRIRKALLEFL